MCLLEGGDHLMVWTQEWRVGIFVNKLYISSQILRVRYVVV